MGRPNAESPFVTRTHSFDREELAFLEAEAKRMRANQSYVLRQIVRKEMDARRAERPRGKDTPR